MRFRLPVMAEYFTEISQSAQESKQHVHICSCVRTHMHFCDLMNLLSVSS
jgi:hypothetical protein